MASIFDSVKGLRPKKNVFNLNHTFSASFDMGQIVPVFSMQDIIPGSTVKVSTGQLTRFQALLAPIMHQIDAYISFWCVPYRLLDSNWNDFISGAMEFDREEYEAPYFTYTGVDAEFGDSGFAGDGTLFDYLGYPAYDPLNTLAFASSLHLTPRPFVAYLLILKYKYINENIMTGYVKDLFEKGGHFDDLLEAMNIGGDISASVATCLLDLLNLNVSMCFPHAWNKDYFTSALPFTQVGDPVVLPLSGSAPVTVEIDGKAISLSTPTLSLGTPVSSSLPSNVSSLKPVGGDGSIVKPIVEGVGDTQHNVTSINGKLETEFAGEADLSQASAISIAELRIANALQSYKELTARIGHRVEEYLLGTFGVVSQDARLQRPQWLATGKVPVNINPVEQTSATDNTSVKGDKTPAGNLTGRGTASGFGFGDFTMYAHEDCMILGLLYIQPKTAYSNRGVNRHLLKTGERFDYFHPKFEHIGEQEIKNCELFLSGDDETDNGTFGYQARYAEYKHWPNEIHGQFASVLSFWHMARIFNTTPTLSPDFIYIKQEDITRPFAVQTVTDGDGNEIPLNNTLNMLAFKVTYKAPMSHYGTPALLN